MKRIGRFLRTLGVDVILPGLLLLTVPLIVIFYCLLTAAYVIELAWRESK